jgi:hypothetical protein
MRAREREDEGEMAEFGMIRGSKHLNRDVMVGACLRPSSHHERRSIDGRWILGTSPRMTLMRSVLGHP